MSLLQGTGLLQHLVHGPANGNDLRSEYPGQRSRSEKKQRSLRSKSSLANLIQFARNPVENVGEAMENWYDGSTKEERLRRQSLEDQKQLSYLKMRMATTFRGWQAAAKELDELEGNNEWKAVSDSSDYDVALVQTRLKQLEDARISCDIERMLFLVRTSLTRDLGDMGNAKMYQHSHIGTKDLVEKYITTALGTLQALLDVSEKAKCDGTECKYLLEQVLSARQAFGRSALLLSGGATFGMNHIGVLRALWEARLLPRIISGASAGSIVGAVVCTRTDEEIPELMATFCDGDLAVFEEEGNEDGVLQKAVRFLKHGALFDIAHLTRVMRDLLGELTFQEAYNRTRRILNICVSSASLYELPRLLNYVTAPNVLIWSAVAASCSVPFVYTAASLLAKDPKTGEAVPWDPSPQRWIDGSVDNDIPMTRLAEMFNVNHFIVSQVNPHVVPFLTKDEKAVGDEALYSPVACAGPTWLDNFSHLAKGEAMHRMRTLAEFGVLPNLLTKTVSVLSQKYSGDITIFPEISYADFPKMLSNPTPESMHLAMLSGQRATWPKLSVVKNHCAIELALDDAVQKLRARVVFSDDEISQRMNSQQQNKHNNHLHPRGSSLKLSSRKRTSKDGEVIDPLTTKAKTTMPSPRSDVARSTHLNLSLRHKKSLSINTLLVPPRRSHKSTETRPSTADGDNRGSNSVNPSNNGNHTALNLHDVTSSGADETSNLSHSSSSTSLDFSSPTESPSSPTLPTPKWSQSLFGSSSQPATPFPKSESLLMSTTPNNRLSKTQSMKPSPDSSGGKSLRSGTSSPEPTFKRPVPRSSTPALSNSFVKEDFPVMTSSLLPSSSSPPPSPPPKSAARKQQQRKNWTMEIDIPAAARGIVGQNGKGKKKSSGHDSGTA